MTVLVTMAGLGSRFSQHGYTVPKYKVVARGRTLFDWSLESLAAFRSEPLVLATLKGEDESWLRDEVHRLGFADVRIFARPALSRGQAETAFDALAAVDRQDPLWIYNIDTYVAYGMAPHDLQGAQGCLHVFPCTKPSMSFVGFDGAGEVARVVEKQAISEWATVGMYGFASAALFAELYRQGYEGGQIPAVRGERYIAPMYDLLLAQGRRVVAPRLAAEAVVVLGTPAEVLLFDPLAVPARGHGA